MTSTDTVINQRVVNTNQVSVGMRFMIPTVVGNKFLGGFAVGGTFEKDININAAGRLQWYVQTEITDTTILDDRRVYDALGTQDHAANRIELYKDGRSVGSNTSTSFLGYTSPPIHVGGAFAGLNATASTVFYFYVWNRALSASEALWLHSEPYAFLRPIIRRRYFVLSAPPAEVATPAVGGQTIYKVRPQRWG